MLDATDFGKNLRELMAKNNFRQEQLAKELGVSPSILSNYITGKNIPEMDFLAKCVDRFSLKGKELKNLFSKAFFGTVQTHHKIILDTSFFREDRLKVLVQIIVALLLYSDRQSSPEPGTNPPLLVNLFRSIENSYDAMDTDDFLELALLSRDV